MIMTIIYSIKETKKMARKLIIVNLKHEHHATIFDHIVNTQRVKKVKNRPCGNVPLFVRSRIFLVAICNAAAVPRR